MVTTPDVSRLDLRKVGNSARAFRLFQWIPLIIKPFTLENGDKAHPIQTTSTSTPCRYTGSKSIFYHSDFFRTKL
jgi:hypothetical protein